MTLVIWYQGYLIIGVNIPFIHAGEHFAYTLATKYTSADGLAVERLRGSQRVQLIRKLHINLHSGWLHGS
jgi:hypothetical protein